MSETGCFAFCYAPYDQLNDEQIDKHEQFFSVDSFVSLLPPSKGHNLDWIVSFQITYHCSRAK